MFWLFVLILLCSYYLHYHYGDCGVLNWNITLPKLSQEFSNDFGLQAALDNEMQTDLLKMSRTYKPDTNLEGPSSNAELSHSHHTMNNYYPKYSATYDTYPNLKSFENVEKTTNFPIDPNDNYVGSFSYQETALSQKNNKQKVNSKKNRKKEKVNVDLFKDFVGTNLFGLDRKNCFSTQDIALLTARRDFENLLPKQWPKFLPNDRTIKTLMNYFEICHQTILRLSYDGTKKLVEQVFYDTLGGYLHHYLVPITKYSFYAGHLSLRASNNILQLHKVCKILLNVNGNGWKEPIQNLENELKDIKIEPLHIDEKNSMRGPSYCLRLNIDMRSSNDDDYDSDRNNQMLVPLPKLEPENNEDEISNIWLPFRNKSTYDLRSDNAAYIVVKFYETVTRCYQYVRTNQDYFNEKFHSWILENVQVHLTDEQFYPGLGAILRINENLSEGKAGNLYGDNLIEEDFAFNYKDDTIQKRDKGSEHKSTYHLSMENFDDETKKFLDDISKTNLLNGLTARWLIEDAGKANTNKNNTVAYNVYNNNVQQDLTQLTKFNSTINPVNSISSTNAINQLDATQNKNVDPQKELKAKFEQIANQSIQSALMQGSNTKPELKSIQDLLPTDWKSPQGIALISIPVILFLLIIFCCCCRGKGKIVFSKAPPKTHVSHKVPVGIPIDSGTSLHSSSTDTLAQKIPRAKKYVAKGPQVPETTSVSFTSSAPSKKPTPSPSPASKGKTPPAAKGKAASPPKAKTPPSKAKTPPPNVKTPPAKVKTPPPKAKTPPPKAKTPPPKAKAPPPPKAKAAPAKKK